MALYLWREQQGGWGEVLWGTMITHDRCWQKATASPGRSALSNAAYTHWWKASAICAHLPNTTCLLQLDASQFLWDGRGSDHTLNLRMFPSTHGAPSISTMTLATLISPSTCLSTRKTDIKQDNPFWRVKSKTLPNKPMNKQISQQTSNHNSTQAVFIPRKENCQGLCEIHWGRFYWFYVDSDEILRWWVAVDGTGRCRNLRDPTTLTLPPTPQPHLCLLWAGTKGLSQCGKAIAHLCAGLGCSASQTTSPCWIPARRWEDAASTNLSKWRTIIPPANTVCGMRSSRGPLLEQQPGGSTKATVVACGLHNSQGLVSSCGGCWVGWFSLSISLSLCWSASAVPGRLRQTASHQLHSGHTFKLFFITMRARNIIFAKSFSFKVKDLILISSYASTGQALRHMPIVPILKPSPVCKRSAKILENQFMQGTGTQTFRMQQEISDSRRILLFNIVLG